MRLLDDLAISAFFESMAMMIQSGIRTDEAVSLLETGGEHTGGMLEKVLAVLKEKTDGGASLSAAMEESGAFPDYAVRMTQTGEKSGRLEEILFRLSTYYKEQKDTREKLKNAVTYPAAMLLMIIAVLLVMLFMVLPAFTDVYDNLTGSLAASSYSYVRWAYVFCWAALVLMALIAAALIIGLLMWKNGKKAPVIKLLKKNGTCRTILENMAVFRFTSALATFIASGEMQDNAVLESLPMTDDDAVEEKIQKVTKHMEEGHGFAQASYEESLFEPVYGRMLLAGERSGNLEGVLGKLAGLLETNCGELIDRLVGTVDPLLSGVLMVTVAVTLLSVMLPLIGILGSIA